MTMSNYPNGFMNGIAIRNLPINVAHPGKIYYVNNSSVLAPGGIGGSNGNDGSYKRPFATLDYAIGVCSANAGDIILIMPGHAETISGASGIVADVAGIEIYGLGNGLKKPLFSFSATASTFDISANNVKIKGIAVLSTIDSVVKGFNVTGSNCELDIESRDTSSAVEFVNVITASSAADGLIVKAQHKGFTAGDAMTRYISLAGVDNAKINVDFYGIASIAVVNMITTACLGVEVHGIFHNGTTALTKDVVDTQGSSKWFVEGYDEVGGYKFIGGSGAAVAALTSSSTVGLGTDGTTVTDSATTVLGAIGADNANNAFASTSIVSNRDGSVLERLEHIAAIDAVGSQVILVKTITSSAIPNNSQAAGGLLATVTGTMVLERIVLQTDSTGIVAPTNLEFSTDNAKGLTGAGAPNALAAVSALGANKTVVIQDAANEVLPLYLESGKKLYVHGDDAAGTGAGTVDIIMWFRRVSADASVS